MIYIVTYQDLLEVGENEQNRMNFVRGVINSYKGSEGYKMAVIADEYDRHRNRTIRLYEKVLYDMAGRARPDLYSSNFKIASRFFNRFVVQEVQYLLGNGVTWGSGAAEGRLGKDFDNRLQDIAHKALVGGVAFGFFNADHVDVFSAMEFAPIYDEENGALTAGVRFWQLADNKPLRATLYEPDGYTDYMWRDGKGEILHQKRSYIVSRIYTDAQDVDIYEGRNYPSFPIVPLYGNPARQSELIGLWEQIDAYDLIKSGFADDLDDIASVYWTLRKAGGMDDVDLAEFVRRLRNLHAVTDTNEEMIAEPHVVDLPYAGREALLDRLRADLYDDAMALDVKEIASGATTATQIRAAYEPLDLKTTQLEYCVLDFITGLLAVAGVEDEATFTRSRIVNTNEEVLTLTAASMYLPEEYITEKILTVLGDGDRADEIIKQMAADNLKMPKEEPQEEPEEEPQEDEESEV